ncbi:MAG: MFS transporter [Chloroflexota bacterium]
MDGDPERAGSSGTLSREQVRSSIGYSAGEGVASAASEGATEEYYVPYALAAGASASIVGWLVALAQLALAFCYLKVPDYVRKIGSRRHAILLIVLVDVVTFLPFIILPFLVRDYLVQTIFLFYIISVVPTIVVGPIWASWITDLVPVGVRGRYMGRRMTFMGASELGCFIAAGVILNWFAGQVFVGFSIIFAFAAMARLASWFMYRRMKDVPIARREEVSHFGFHDVVPAVRNGSVGQFMVFAASLYFTIFLASPFFAVFMLSELQFSYLAFMIVICSEQAARLAILRFWGRYADARGSLRVIKLVSVVIPMVPVLWLVSQNIVYLVFVQIITGLALAGFELCAANFMYGAAPAGGRIKYIALFRALNCTGAAVGALLGGYLAVVLVPIFGHKLLALFLLSGLLRGVVVLKFLPSIIDVTLKCVTKPDWGSYRPRGMLAADAITDGFGWGLLYIPESMRRDLSRVFEERRILLDEKSSQGKEGLIRRFARLAARQLIAEKSLVSESQSEHEKLRLVGLRCLAVGQVERPGGGSNKPAVSEKGRWFSEELWRSLRQRFGIGTAVTPAEASARVALLHNVELGQKLVEAKTDQHQVKDKASGRGKRGELYQKWSREALRQRIEAQRKPPAETGRALNKGLLHNPQAWQAHINKETASKNGTGLGGRLQPEARREGLLYRDGAREAFKSRSDGKNSSDRIDRVKPSSSRDGLLHSAQAWNRYSGTPGKAKSDTRQDIVNVSQAGQLGFERQREGLMHALVESLDKHQAWGLRKGVPDRAMIAKLRNGLLGFGRKRFPNPF